MKRRGESREGRDGEPFGVSFEVSVWPPLFQVARRAAAWGDTRLTLMNRKCVWKAF